jgi:hypothetical protein
VKIGADQTCPVHEPDMSGKVYWKPSMDPDKSRGLRSLSGLDMSRLGVGHVRFCVLEFS